MSAYDDDDEDTQVTIERLNTARSAAVERVRDACSKIP